MKTFLFSTPVKKLYPTFTVLDPTLNDISLARIEVHLVHRMETLVKSVGQSDNKTAFYDLCARYGVVTVGF